MHFYSGVNVPRPTRRLIKAINGDTLKFTVNVCNPTTGAPITVQDMSFVDMRVVIAENRFSQPIWEGVYGEWMSIDDNRPGLVHVTIPRLVTSVLRRGSYAFSVVVDSGDDRATPVTGNIQIEYETGSPLHDIPYRRDGVAFDPIGLSPALDTLLQPKSNPTYEEIVALLTELSSGMSDDGAVGDVELAVGLIARIVMRHPNLASEFVPLAEHPTYADVLASIRDMVSKLGR